MRARSLTFLLVLAALGGAACGSSSKSAGSTTSSTAAPAASGASGSSGGGGTTGAASSTTQKVSGDSNSSFCNLARTDEAIFKSQAPTSIKPGDLKKLYENIGPTLANFASKAPSQIKGDLETFSTAFDKVAKALSDANYDYTKLSPTTFAGLDTPAVKAASNHIEQYFTQVCHINTSS